MEWRKGDERLGNYLGDYYSAWERDFEDLEVGMENGFVWEPSLK